MAPNTSYNITFDEFETDIKCFRQELQHKEDFCDMILVCEDTQFQVHKAIVASSSPVLGNILIKSKENNFIYFRGMYGKDLKNVINFMYEGEINIGLEDLGRFLVIGNDFSLKGIPQLNKSNSTQSDVTSKKCRNYKEDSMLKQIAVPNNCDVYETDNSEDPQNEKCILPLNYVEQKNEIEGGNNEKIQKVLIS